MNKTDIGDFGERAACEFLARNGYLIERRNFKVRTGEIDIIAMDRDFCRVFVEVKTRKSSSYGCASEFVDRAKQERIRNTALLYCGGEAYMRFDVVEVYYSICQGIMKVEEINHIEDAF